MVKKYYVITIIVLAILTSCATVKDTTVDFNNTNDVIAFSHAASKAISKDKGFLLKTKTYNHRGYKEFVARIYPTSGGLPRVRNTYRQFCNKIGGIVGGSAYLQTCKTSNGGDRVIFIARISDSGIRSGGGRPNIHIKLLTPKKKMMLSREYQNAIKNIGYIPIDEVLRNREKQQKLTQLKSSIEHAKIKSNQARFIKEKSRIRTIGSKICKDIKSVRYVGFTENFSTNKIQIRVSNAEIIGSKYLAPSGFKPQIIWDDPSLWFLCE